MHCYGTKRYNEKKGEAFYYIIRLYFYVIVTLDILFKSIEFFFTYLKNIKFKKCILIIIFLSLNIIRHH